MKIQEKIDRSALVILYDWLMSQNREPAQTFFTEGILRTIGKEIEYQISKPKQETQIVNTQECSYCDGCGWVEGGISLKTTCKFCSGTGIKL